MLSVNETHLLTLNGWTLRVRHGQGAAPRLLFMLHGWTGDENSMWVFAPRRPEYWIVAPRALYPTQPGGYSWRPLLERKGWPKFEELRPAAEKLYQLAEELGALWGLNPFPLDLMGFSQGAATAAVFLLLYPEQVRKVALLSGFLPAGSETLLQPSRLLGKEVLVAHGTQDELVPYAWAEQLVQALQDGGARVEFCAENVGHKVGASCARMLQEVFS